MREVVCDKQLTLSFGSRFRVKGYIYILFYNKLAHIHGLQDSGLIRSNMYVGKNVLKKLQYAFIVVNCKLLVNFFSLFSTLKLLCFK